MRRAMRVAGSAVAVLLVAILVSGCSESYVTAVGPNGDATLFSDFAIGDDRRDLVRGLLTQRIETPVRPERAFHLDLSDSTGFRMRRDWRNIVFLADMGSESWSAGICRGILNAAAHRELVSQPAGYVFAQDTWADGQTVLFIHAADRDALEEMIASEGGRLIDTFHEYVIQGLQKTLYVSGEQTALAEGIRQRHDYRIRIPAGFFVEEQADNRFVRMKEVLADGAVMFLFIYYQHQFSDTLDANFCMALRDTLAAVYSGGDRIEHSRTVVREREFQGRPALEVYGLYQNYNPPMGGPFKTICFHAARRFYMIDMAVFNPPGEKLPQLRILEAVARSFEPVEPSG